METSEVKVFISYSREDLERLSPVIEHLERGHCRVWWDVKIQAGDDFRAAIHRSILDCDKCIVFWSKNSSQSFWVLEEAEEARRLNKLLPLAIDPGSIPFGFRSLQTELLVLDDDASWQCKLNSILRSQIRSFGETGAPGGKIEAQRKTTPVERGYFGLMPQFSPINEVAFISHFNNSMNDYRELGVLVGILGSLTFLLWDKALDHATMQTYTIYARIFILSPLVVIGTFAPKFTHPKCAEWIQFSAMMAFSATILWIEWILTRGLINGTSGIMLCFIFYISFLRVRLRLHIATHAFIVFSYCALSYADYFISDRSLFISNAIHIVSGSFFALSAAFVFERSERLNFAKIQQLSVMSFQRKP